MKLYLEKEDKTTEIELKEKVILKKLLKELNISINSVILVKNSQICLEEEEISNEDELKILSVVSGG